MKSQFELTIQPRKGWQPIDFKEVYLYRELLVFLVWRDIKIRYRQTILGGLWAFLQPLIAMLVFTFIFNKVAGMKSDGPPYQLFAFCGVAAWNFFSTSVSQSSNSLITNQQMVSKVYFPRFFIPLGSIGAFLMDLALSIGLMGLLMIYYHWPLTWTILELPIFILGAFLASAGVGLGLSAINVSYRDVKYAVPFILQMGIFASFVVYPISYLPQKWRMLACLNPMAGIVMGFRHAILGSPASWSMMGLSLAVSLFLFVAGLFIFRRMETVFADVI